MFPEGRIVDFLIVGAVALIVVGPKDLPLLMRKVGQFVARMRAMAAEFRASFDEIARQSELDELRREVEAMRAGAVLGGVVGLDHDTDKVFEDIHAGLNETQPSLPFDAAPSLAHSPLPSATLAPEPEPSAPPVKATP